MTVGVGGWGGGVGLTPDMLKMQKDFNKTVTLDLKHTPLSNIKPTPNIT